ncbi:MAG: metal ABC transporter substrate-binding protein [Desulfobacterales bacterium]|jgi:ABC-type Zn uptake system ZnuABC Zn-binding protein ZnuA|nr:metal ABC transporter substrate-binding protein [Desulfobacterales bacterium]
MPTSTSILYKSLLGALALLMAVAAAGVEPADARSQHRLKVVATTSLIAEIVSDLGGPAVAIATLIPPASCPGHFDIKPDDMRLLADAELFLLHHWQGRTFSDGIIRASGNNILQKAVLEVPGNWMAPATQIEATERIAAILAETDPGRAESYRTAAARRAAAVHEAGTAQARRLAAAAAGRTVVLANDMQADFVRWAGFQVAGVFGRGEDMSPRDVEEAIRRGRTQAVRLVVDNLQSGKQAGINIAKEIGAAQVTLSNFPGGFEGTESWALAIARNVDLLIAAIER